MAARIGRARLRSNTDKTITADEYVPEIHRGDVLCPYMRCGCALQGVQASTRNVNGEQVAVSAFFRLPPNAETEGRGHALKCRLNVKSTIERLVARSREIRRFDEGAEPMLQARMGLTEFRLHILMELFDAVRRRWEVDPLADPVGDSRPTGTRYLRSARVIDPYLRIARAVLSLIARVQDRPELAAYIRLKYGTRTIPWEEYFFDLGDYAGVHDLLAQAPKRPVALAVKIMPGDPRRTKNGYWYVAGRAMRCDSASSGAIAVRPALFFRDNATAMLAAAHEYVLICGIARVGALRDPAKRGLRPEVSVNLDIVSKTQLCRYSPTLTPASS